MRMFCELNEFKLKETLEKYHSENVQRNFLKGGIKNE